MKKLTSALIVFILLTTLAPVHAVSAAQSVRVALPTFNVTLNGTLVDSLYSEYPLIVYKGITYFPMTYYGCRYLGLQTNWSSETGLDIRNTGISCMYRDHRAGGKNDLSYNATIVNTPVRLNGMMIDNTKEEYPLLLFRGLTYFPLTWRFAVDEFGWAYSFNHKDGLIINSANPTVITLDIKTPSPSIDGSPVSTSFFVIDGMYYLRGDNREIYRGSFNDSGERGLVYLLPDDYWSHQKVYFYSRNNQFHINYLSRIGGEMWIDGTVRFNKDGSWEEVEPFWEYFGDVSVMVKPQSDPSTRSNLFIRYGDSAPFNFGDPGYSYGFDWQQGMFYSGGSESRSLYLIDNDIYVLAYELAKGVDTTGVYKVNTATNVTTRVVDAHVINFLIEGETLYYVNEADYRVYSMPLAGGDATPLTGELSDGTGNGVLNRQIINYMTDIQVLNGTVYYIRTTFGLHGYQSRQTLCRTGDSESSTINSAAYAQSIQLHNGYIIATFDSNDGNAYRLMVFNAAGDVVFKTSDNAMQSTITVGDGRLYYVESETRLVGTVRLPPNR